MNVSALKDEARRFAVTGDHDACDRGTDETAAIADQRRHRDGVREVFLAADELDQIRVAHRKLDRDQQHP